MLQTIGLGLITAVVVCFSQILRLKVQDQWIYAPGFILLVGGVAVILQKWIINSQKRDHRYNGLADLLIYIHNPMAQGGALSWAAHGLVSFLLTLSGGVAGVEGAAIEWMQALQMELDSFSVRWFEQIRRTHVASIVASAVAAAFGAPFAGLVLTFELGIGGRSLSAALSALTAFLGSRWLIERFSIPSVQFHGILPQFSFLDWKDWSGLLFVGLAGGAAASFLIFAVRYTRESLSDLFNLASQQKIVVVTILLFCIRWVSGPFNLPTELLMEQALWSKFDLHQLMSALISQFLILLLLIGGLGSVGWMWPVFSLGSIFGCTIFQFAWPGAPSVIPAAGLAGAVTFWATLLNAPLSAAILVFELTQDFQFILPVWVIASVAIWVRKAFKIRPLIEYDLKDRGQDLYLGRSLSVLNAISVQDAMVTDHVWVYDSDSQAEVYTRISQSPYPFLPVVHRDGRLAGLLTADLILFEISPEVIRSNYAAKLLEAKDLVYQFGVKPPTVLTSDRLKTVVHSFDEFPCLPVLGADQKLVGLLLASQVRLVYEREVGRRSFNFVPKEENE
jgi:CIC family chloride channel protein